MEGFSGNGEKQVPWNEVYLLHAERSIYTNLAIPGRIINLRATYEECDLAFLRCSRLVLCAQGNAPVPVTSKKALNVYS